MMDQNSDAPLLSFKKLYVVRGYCCVHELLGIPAHTLRMRALIIFLWLYGVGKMANFELSKKVKASMKSFRLYRISFISGFTGQG